MLQQHTFDAALLKCNKEDFKQFKKDFKTHFCGFDGNINMQLTHMRPTQWMLLEFFRGKDEKATDELLQKIFDKIKS